MNKILFVTTIPGTLRSFLLPFAQHFRAKGWQVDAMAQGISTCAKCLHSFDRVWEVEWSRNPLDPQNLIIAPPQIRKAIAQQDYDIVHVHTPVAAFVTRYALNNLRQQKRPKLIYTAHGFHFYRGGKPLKNLSFLALEKLAGRWTDYLVVINREDEEAAKRYGIVPTERVCYTPGIGVDTDYYSPGNVPDSEVVRVRQELGLSPETPLFLSIAEFNPGKRHQDILKALARLGRSKVQLAFAGTGPLMEQMQLLASNLGIQSLVHFLGYRQDIPALIRASTATLLASEREGLPRSVMESLCLEIPVIGTQTRGIRDLLEGDCGLLVKLGDVEDLAQAMARILDRPEEAKMMGKRGRERMKGYEVRQIIKLYDRLYAQALEEKNYAVSQG
ncbi:MAG TPA: glycosyltransferase family 1 protein [Cyanobacteria bacterium UBA11049]|nr:glycosyltransferase family 1 protein [Cyanobacteria bacterium UBA11049]